MFGDHFNHELLKKYTAVFGTMFNNIKVRRDDNQFFKVPVAYGPRAKFIARLEGDPNAKRKVAITLPRIGFELVSMNYDSENQLGRIQEIISSDPESSRPSWRKVFMSVPYDLHFQLSIMTKTIADGYDILGQILPYFAPSYTVSMKPLDGMDVSIDVPIILESAQPEDTYQGDMITRRALIWNLEFNMKVRLYGPRSNRGQIKLVKANIHPTMNKGSEFERVTTRPGLTVDGLPTSDINESVPLSQINEDDDYGYIVDIQHFLNEDDDV